MASEAGQKEADMIRNMDPETLAKAMAGAQKDEKGEFKMTDDEVHKFTDAFKEPEFRRMMAEYVEEISDPKHREEQNAYIRELEAKGEVPAGKDPIHPDAGFVVKTHKLAHADADIDPTGAKVFVNIVSHERIDAPVSTKATGGENWSIPHVTGPPRMEQDKKGSTASTFDCCFHPRALAMAERQRAFRDLIIRLAFESIESSYEKHGGGEKLGRSYHVLRGVDYKTGKEPQVLLLPKKEQEPNAPAAEKKEETTTTASSSSNNKKNKKKNKKQQEPAPSTKDGFGSALKGKLSAAIAEEDAVPPPSNNFGDPTEEPLPEESDERPVESLDETPVYSVKERGYFDMGDHTMSATVRDAKLRRRPKELVISIELPRCAGAGKVDLDVADRSVKLSCVEVDDGTRPYKLEIPRLSYAVDGAKGTAKFDRKKRILSVTVPLLPPAPHEDDDAPAPPEPVDEEENLVTEVVKEEEQEEPAVKEEEQEEEPVKKEEKKEKEVEHSRWLASDREVTPRRDFASDAPPKPADVKEPTEEVKEPETSSFIAAAAFEGAKPGRVFKSGTQGVGYYSDGKKQEKKQESCSLPEVGWRQQRETVTLLVKVPNAESVKLKYTSENEIELNFTSSNVAYGALVRVGAAVDPVRTTFDVADKNLCVVIYKVKADFIRDDSAQPAVVVEALARRGAEPTQQKAPPPPAPKAPKAPPAKAPAAPPKAPVVVAPTTFKNTLLFEID